MTTAVLCDSPVPVGSCMTADFLRLMAEGEPVTFQTFADRGKDPRLAQHFTGDLDECAQRLAALNDAGAGVFWMVNEGDGLGRSTANVTAVRALFVDLDGAPHEPATNAACDAHALVESSPGRFHVYWLVEGCRLDQFKPAQLALARKFGGDMSVHDLPRVMRLPGFVHRKGEPFLTCLKGASHHQPYPFADLVARLGLDLSEPKRLPATQQPQGAITPGGRHMAGVNYLVRPCCLTKECYPSACCRSGPFISSMVEGCGHVGEGRGGGQRRPRSGALSTVAAGAPQAHRPYVHSLPGREAPGPSASKLSAAVSDFSRHCSGPAKAPQDHLCDTRTAPSLDPALQCSQLRLVAIHLWDHHDQSLHQDLGRYRGLCVQPAFNDRPRVGERIRSRSPPVFGLGLRAMRRTRFAILPG